jgi:hypothetical protein
MFGRTSAICAKIFGLHAACRELSREYLNVAPHIADCRDAKAYVLSQSRIFFAQISMLRRTSGISSRKFQLHAACCELSREYLNVAPDIADCRDAKTYVLSQSRIFFAQISMLRRMSGISSRKFQLHAACGGLSREYLNAAQHIADCRETKAHVLSHVRIFARDVRMFHRRSSTSARMFGFPRPQAKF